MITLQHGDQTFVNFTPEVLAARGVPSAAIAAAQLAQARAAAISAIGAAAGRARARYITTIPGQEMTYVRKAEQARAWSLLGAPAKAAATAADYPLLFPEAAALGQTVDALAAGVLAAESAWALKGGQIEAARVGGNEAARQAATPAAVATAAATAVAALDAL